MIISAREKQILNVLLTHRKGLTVKEIADDIGVSERTVRRDLKGIEKIAKSFHLQLNKKAGFGIQIIGDDQDLKALKHRLLHEVPTEYTPLERQTLILCTLLEASRPIKLFALAHDLRVTNATISHDLDKLEEKLKPFELRLVRRRGYGIEIKGSEKAKRQVMSKILMENIDESQFLAMIKDQIQNKSGDLIDSISDRMLGLVERKNILLVDQVIKEVRDELPYAFADSAYIGLIVHLSLAIERIRRGEKITIEPGFLEDLRKTKEFAFAKKIAEKLEGKFHIKIPEAEVGYISMHLSGAKLRFEKEIVLEEDNLQLAVLTKRLINKVGERIGRDLSPYHSLYQGLLAHLKPAMYRMKQNMGITNPLLEKIKTDYRELFHVVKAAVHDVFQGIHVPDEEIGYIVMHFGSCLVRGPNRHDLKALIICSSGIGTSKMLASRLKQEIPEIVEYKTTSVFELDKTQLDRYDLVISTVDLPGLPDEAFVVNPIPSEKELERIKNYVDVQAFKKAVHRSEPIDDNLAHRLDENDVLTLFKQMNEYLNAAISVLETFAVVDLTERGSLWDILNNIAKNLMDAQLISDRQSVAGALLKRESQGALGIPRSTLALFHSKDRHVLKPIFRIYALPKPLPLKAMDQEEMMMKHALVLLSPESLSPQGLELLSYISALIIESEETLALFQSEDQEKIYAYLSQRLWDYSHQKFFKASQKS
jgi:mannitol operon transcriptional antiterminator